MFRDDEYPETRMTNLLKLVGDSVIQFIQSSLAAKDIWRSSFTVADRYGRGVDYTTRCICAWGGED